MHIPGIKKFTRTATAIVGGVMAAMFGAGAADANEAEYQAARSDGSAAAFTRFVAENPSSDRVADALCDLAEIDLNAAAGSARTVYEAGEDPTSSLCVEDGGLDADTGAARLIIV